MNKQSKQTTETSAWPLLSLLFITISFSIGIILAFVLPRLALSPHALETNNYNVPPENFTITWRFVAYSIVILAIIKLFTIFITETINPTRHQRKIITIISFILTFSITILITVIDTNYHTKNVPLITSQHITSTNDRDGYYYLTDTSNHTYKIDENNYLNTSDLNNISPRIKIIYHTPVQTIN